MNIWYNYDKMFCFVNFLNVRSFFTQDRELRIEWVPTYKFVSIYLQVQVRSKLSLSWYCFGLKTGGIFLNIDR